MKKVMVCGCGAQGSTICRKLDQEPNIEEVICADFTPEALATLFELRPEQLSVEQFIELTLLIS